MYQLTQTPSIIFRVSDSAHIPADQRNSDYRAYLHWLSSGNTPVPYVAPIPQSVSMAQARLALLSDGTLEAVMVAVSTMPMAAQIEWEFRATVERQSSLVTAIGGILSKSGAELDALFVLAATL